MIRVGDGAGDVGVIDLLEGAGQLQPDRGNSGCEAEMTRRQAVSGPPPLLEHGPNRSNIESTLRMRLVQGVIAPGDRASSVRWSAQGAGKGRLRSWRRRRVRSRLGWVASDGFNRDQRPNQWSGPMSWGDVRIRGTYAMRCWPRSPSIRSRHRPRLIWAMVRSAPGQAADRRHVHQRTCDRRVSPNPTDPAVSDRSRRNRRVPRNRRTHLLRPTGRSLIRAMVQMGATKGSTRRSRFNPIRETTQQTELSKGARAADDQSADGAFLSEGVPLRRANVRHGGWKSLLPRSRGSSAVREFGVAERSACRCMHHHRVRRAVAFVELAADFGVCFAGDAIA